MIAVYFRNFILNAVCSPGFVEKPKVGKSTLQWMLLNMVDPTLSVCVQTGETACILEEQH